MQAIIDALHSITSGVIDLYLAVIAQIEPLLKLLELF